MSSGLEIVDNKEKTEKPPSSMRKTCFTLYAVTEADREKLINMNNIKLLVFQLEVCPTTKREHFQGYMEFQKPMPFKRLKDLFPVIHVEKPNGTALQSYNYCTKEDTRKAGPWLRGDWSIILDSTKKKKNNQGKRNDLKITELITDIQAGVPYKELIVKYNTMFFKSKNAFDTYYEQYKPQKKLTFDFELYEWQQKVIELLNKPRVHRRIIWIWSEASETGKSVFKQYCESQYSVIELSVDSYTNFIHCYDNHNIIWLNLSREDVLTTSYIKMLERLSDGGYTQSTKFNGTRKFIDAHVVVTSNQEPPFDRLPKRILEFNVDIQKDDSECETELQFDID